jgi:hypothetical protein
MYGSNSVPRISRSKIGVVIIVVTTAISTNMQKTLLGITRIS